MATSGLRNRYPTNLDALLPLVSSQSSQRPLLAGHLKSQLGLTATYGLHHGTSNRLAALPPSVSSQSFRCPILANSTALNPASWALRPGPMAISGLPSSSRVRLGGCY